MSDAIRGPLSTGLQSIESSLRVLGDREVGGRKAFESIPVFPEEFLRVVGFSSRGIRGNVRRSAHRSRLQFGAFLTLGGVGVVLVDELGDELPEEVGGR